jgi:hypothetical protein
MAETATTAAEKTKKPKQGRSPAYPGLNIQQALVKAKALYDAEGKYPAPMPSAFAAWGYGAKSSGGRETRAALKYFGMITVDGDTDTGKVKLTDKALRVLLDEREDQSEKQALIREFALTPPIHKQLFEKFPDGIKSDATVEHFLVFDEGYNKSAAAELVAEFKATAAYAGLYKPAIVLDIKSEQSQNSAVNGQKEPAKVGDLVQVEIDGAFQLEKPKRVRAIQDHDGKPWVFVDDHETGVPMEQVTVVEQGSPATLKANDPPRLPLEAPAGDWREERLLDEEGEEIFVRYKGEPSKERYEFIRDYLDFKVKRMK